MLTKILLVLAVLIAGLAYMIYTPLSPDIEEPWKIRIINGLVGVALAGGVIGEKLGFGTSLNISRPLLDKVLNIGGPSVDPLLVEREDTVFNGVPVRIYRPKSILKSKAPVAGLVYFHGGGWVFGSIESHDMATAYYAVEANIIVVSVEYRMAPEYPYPVPLEDCRTALEYFITNAAKFNLDPKRVAIGGDSAGGNLAAGLSLALRDAKFNPMPKAQVLIYAVLQVLDFNTPSFFEHIKSSPDDTTVLAMFVRMYLGIPVEYEDALKKNRHVTPSLRQKYGGYLNPNFLPKEFVPSDYKPTDPSDWDKTVSKEAQEKFVHPYVSPGLAEDLRGLPEAFVFTAGGDALRDEGAMFAHRLKQAGVKTTWLNIKETVHGCQLLSGGILGTNKGREANEAIVKFFKETL